MLRNRIEVQEFTFACGASSIISWQRRFPMPLLRPDLWGCTIVTRNWINLFTWKKLNFILFLSLWNLNRQLTIFCCFWCFWRRIATSRHNASFSCLMAEKRVSNDSCRLFMFLTSFSTRATVSVFVLLVFSASACFGLPIFRLMCSSRYGCPFWKNWCENSISSFSNFSPPLSIDVILWKPYLAKREQRKI